MPKPVDAIVVGLGASGSIIAEQLALAGVKVLALEKGPHYSEDHFRFKHDEIRYYTRGNLVPHLTTDPITWRARDGDTACILPWATGPLGTSEPLHLPPSIGAGGGTLHWGGACWRFREADFRMHSELTKRFGKNALPADSTMVDWPFGYADLESYYDRVEWDLGVSGQAGNISGELIPGGNQHEAPRRRGYPMPPLRSTAGTPDFIAACQRLGYKPFPQSAAIASEDYKALKRCVYCGFCHGYACHVGAKQSAHVTSVPSALATGNLEIKPFSRVFRIDHDSKTGRATGVSYFDSMGTVHEEAAEIVILACYALENTRLMLLSGLNHNGEVGRHFMTHCFGWFTGLMPTWTNSFMGPLVAAHIMDDLTSELIPENDEGALWGSPLTSFPGDTQPIEAAYNLPPFLRRWGKDYKHWMADNYRRLFSMHTQTASFPYQGGACDLDPNIKDRYGLPALRMTHEWRDHDVRSLNYFSGVKKRVAKEMGLRDYWEEPNPPAYHLSTHEVGTHRMGLDPATSVVDPFGQAHGTPGLYVVGGGQFPTLPTYNPTQTIQALAFLTADSILGRVN